MNEIYNKLNFYLNEICVYLEEENSFLLENIDRIARLNDVFLQNMKNYSLDNSTIQNQLTFEEVYFIAREVVEKIDRSYLEEFDNLINSGELDFGYENQYESSHCVCIPKKYTVERMINISRQYNYNDVYLLIHEFIHYTNGKGYSNNKYYLAEFLSIYFELYTVDYLLEKGINKQELDYLSRIKITRKHSIIFFQYEMVLLAFIKSGNLNENTISFIQQYHCGMKKEMFEKECLNVYKNLQKIEKENKDQIIRNPTLLGQILSEKFLIYNYRYILGTFLAIYAQKHSKFNAVVDLNNHINEYENETVFDVCLKIGIDLKDPQFPYKLFEAINEYLKNKQFDKEKQILK